MPTTPAIEITELLSEADKQSLWGWGEDIFQTASLALRWRVKQWHLIVRDGPTAISKVSVLRHQIRLQRDDHSQILTVGGIGGVVTIPQARQTGLARHLMNAADRFMRDELIVDYGFLFCLEFMLPFYRSLGWIEIEEPVEFEQPAGPVTMRSPLKAMYKTLTHRCWRGGMVYLESEPW